MVTAKLSWKDGPQMQSVKSHCLMNVGQKRKSDSTTEDRSFQATPAERAQWQKEWEKLFFTKKE